MTYQRKTVDEWQMWSNYGYGWECELTEETWPDMRQRLKEYRANAPQGVYRAKKVRVPVGVQP